MRFAMILAGALALSACGKDEGSETVANADTGLTADHITANDVTAIDAVTGEAANMAADVNFFAESNAVDSNASAGSADRPSRPASRPAAPATPPAGTNTSTDAEPAETNAQ